VTQLKIVAGLPVDEGAASEVDPAWRLAAAFVLGCRTESTRRAYARDIRAFYT
jgi:integrase/recombinase XerD